MSTFGEIVEPVSRTAWEDWDDITPERNVSELKWQQNTEVANEIDTLLIFEGKYLSDCVKTAIHSQLDLVNCIPEVSLHLFRMKSSQKYICTLKDYSVVLSSEIVELLKPYLCVSKNVISIQTKSLNEYQAVDFPAQDCIIRMISATKAPSKFLDIQFPKLEQPNIISGVSAGVITLREHLNQPGTALVCYMEHPEEYKIDEMDKLLGKLNISQESKSRPSSVLNSNIYI